MKISIRLSILSILLLLLLGSSILIVGVDYVNLHNILIKTTKSDIDYASAKIAAQVDNYLQPLKNYVQVGATLISEDIVIPSAAPSFFAFLHSLLATNREHGAAFGAVFWAGATGDYYLLKRSAARELTGISIETERHSHSAKSIEKTYDAQFNLRQRREYSQPLFDARVTSWYREAKLKQQPLWLVAPMAIAGPTKSALGITTVVPVYDQEQQLRGMLGMELLLGTIASYVKKLKITPHSVAFICDPQGKLLTAYSAHTDLAAGYNMPRLEDLGLVWAKESFRIYHTTHAPLFTYSYANKQYIAAYKEIPDITGSSYWEIAIVTPFADIAAPLQRGIAWSFLFILGVVIIGMIAATLFSARVSKPIVKLAQDAELICQLKLRAVKRLSSWIKEIAYMEEAFGKMRGALRSFQRYMPVTLVKNLISSGQEAEVGGETKTVTLLFADIKNFTPISENMTPQAVMQYLSEYFQVVTKIINNTQGTVDKYIGDAVMAFWGAPITDLAHAFHACQAAVQLRAVLAQLNKRWQQEGLPQVMTRIGINTGQVVVGNVGSDDRLNYTALGDEVNLASRLESLNKAYKTWILVSEQTYNIVHTAFKLRLVDKVAVKGKTQGIRVYELLGDKVEEGEQFIDYSCAFQRAFAAYEQGAWEEGYRLFTEMAYHYPDDNLLPIFIKRCQTFKQNPPAIWHGVWVMEHK